ncbi:hypothetical protein [Marinobacterium sediminicola]|nr:hypothetical protein [Marinobacterium sediminicola]ULG68160.1 hypothetical protein LN244_10640 [Marinobacterium sediminicola]
MKVSYIFADFRVERAASSLYASYTGSVVDNHGCLHWAGDVQAAWEI